MIDALSNIKKKINNIDVVFIDIFDTIVTRNIAPEYVKKLWAQYIARMFNLEMDHSAIYLERKNIEADLCETNLSNGLDSEFSYNAMIKVLYKNIIEPSRPDISYLCFLRVGAETEVEIESAVQTVNKDILNIIIYARNKGKKVICISDMYLSKPMIKEIFFKLGIAGLIDDIFISSEELISKRSGRLYAHVLQKKKLRPEDCIMIGNNLSQDHDIPKSLEIQACIIDDAPNMKRYADFMDNNTEKAIMVRLEGLIKRRPILPFIGSVYSLYLFTERLYFRLLETGAQDVIFFSREGEYLKRLFDNYQETILTRKIRSHYFLVSRKSTYIASLECLNKEDFKLLFRSYSNISAKEFLKSLNFSDEEVSLIKANSKPKFNYNQKITDFQNSNELSGIINNNTFRDIYSKKRILQRRLFREYLGSMVDLDKHKLHIVDIGWKGTIQDNMQKIMPSIHIEGHYLGINMFDKSSPQNKEGLVFSNYPLPSRAFSLYNENRPLFEIVLGASHGSAEQYFRGSSGRIEVETSNIKRERIIFNKKIKPIQEEMFLRFCEIKNVLQNRAYSLKAVERTFNREHFRMVFSPSIAELDFFNSLYHYENFGLFSFTEFNHKAKLRPMALAKEYLRYFLRHKNYTTDYYWCQLKNYNHGLKLLMRLYELERYLYFKVRRII